MLNLNAIFLPGLWYCRGRGRGRWCSSWRRMGNRGTLRLNTWRLPCTTSSRWSATCYSSLRLRHLSRWWHCTKWLSLGIELVIRLCRMDCFCYHNCFSVIFPIKKMFTFLKKPFYNTIVLQEPVIVDNSSHSKRLTILPAQLCSPLELYHRCAKAWLINNTVKKCNADCFFSTSLDFMLKVLKASQK